MPVICYVLPDPTDVVIQGSVLPERIAAVSVLDSSVVAGPNMESPILSLLLEENGPDLWWLDPSPITVFASPEWAPRANGGIATPCGAYIPVRWESDPRLGKPNMSTTRWEVAGTTYDASNNPLPGCRVVLLDIGALAVGGTPVIREQISDGTGKFSISSPGNGNYQVIAYLPGTPDRAGITLHPVVPTHTE